MGTGSGSNRINDFQTEWSVDELLKGLTSKGVEFSLRIDRSSRNKVSIEVTTTNRALSYKALDKLLQSLYLIPSEG